eukprot:TRINITY_DN27_c0_g1_i1.p1 TRINITY_DN27_c0_g1~~TRINITY_DN27_c0_g1_i1.p1  ORF type:complete len:959 (-),score=173.64 TRINITY_DN27_c0_g1_i1:85-2559(-)
MDVLGAGIFVMSEKEIANHLMESCDDLAACDQSACTDEMELWGLQWFFDMGCSTGEEIEEEEEDAMELHDGKMDQQSCGMLGGKFFRYAYVAPECEVLGFAWDWNGPNGTQGNLTAGHWKPGTHMCCIHGEREWCHEWSMDDNAESCQKCGGTWRSIFQWRRWGGWVEGQWKKSYKWQGRSFDSVNSWVTIIGWGELLYMWESVISGLKSTVFKNFIQCRIEPTIGNLIALAKQEPPKATLGSATALPGQASSKVVGQVAVDIGVDSIGGEDEVEITFVKEPAKGAVTASSRRLSYGGFLEKHEAPAPSSRRLSDNDIEMTASCYTVVQYGNKWIGQLVGDCLQFAPSAELAGPVTLCIPIKSDIPLNENFTVDGFATKSGNTITAIGTTVTRKSQAEGEQFCGSIQSSGVYCPVRRYDNYITTTESADNTCGAVEQLKTVVAAASEKLVQEGFTGDGSFVAEGEEVVVTDDDDAGVAFGASTEVVADVTFFAAVAEKPTATPTAAPTAVPTPAPTPLPPGRTAAPTAVPTVAPTAVPTAVPPTAVPTAAPTRVPTAVPTPLPPGQTLTPTAVPTVVPTAAPTAVPPTAAPTAAPTPAPTAAPTPLPPGHTLTPTAVPTVVPTAAPTAAPTAVPPTATPTAVPTSTTTVPPATTTTTVSAVAKVSVGFTVQNVDYSQLTADATLVLGFTTMIKKTLAESTSKSTGKPVSTSMIEVTLSAGSVKVDAEITPPAGATVGEMTSAIAQEAGTMQNDLVTAIKQVPGVDAVTTGGGIGLAGFQLATVEDTTTTEEEAVDDTMSRACTIASVTNYMTVAFCIYAARLGL